MLKNIQNAFGKLQELNRVLRKDFQYKHKLIWIKLQMISQDKSNACCKLVRRTLGRDTYSRRSKQFEHVLAANDNFQLTLNLIGCFEEIYADKCWNVSRGYRALIIARKLLLSDSKRALLRLALLYDGGIFRRAKTRFDEPQL